jgi:hypothetical protein
MMPMMVYGSESCGMSFKSFDTFSASSGMHAASAVGSGGGPSESGMAFTQLKTATTVSMMSNTGISGVSAGWMASIRLNCWMLTPPGSVMTGGSPSSGISRQIGRATFVSFRWGRRWAGRRGRQW